MFLDSFRVPGANENPLDENRLPKSRPEIELPVVKYSRKEDYQHAVMMLVFLLFACGLSGFFSNWTLLCGNALPMLVLSIIGCKILPYAFPHEPSQWNRGLYFLFYPALAGLILGVVFYELGSLGTTALVLLVLFITSVRFQRHYVHRATAGMLSKQIVDDVRSGRFPKGLRGHFFLLGFVDAVVSILSYNRDSIISPGTFQSPAGTYSQRTALTIGLLMVLAFLTAQLRLPGLMLLVDSTDRNQVWAFVVVTPFLCIALWLGAMFFSCVFYCWRRFLAVVLFGVAGFFGLAGFEAIGAISDETTIGLLLLHLLICGLAFLLVCGSSIGTWGKLHALKSKQIASAHWPGFMARLNSSGDKLEKESLYMGLVDFDGSPVLYSLKQLFRHAWVVGKTGSGKTAYLMGNLLYQLIYRFEDISVVFVDAKATSYEVLGTMQKAAEAAGKRRKCSVPVKHFTIDHKQETFVFNIFSQLWWQSLTAVQRTGVVLSSLSLLYATAYGQSYFRDAAFEIIHHVFQRHPDIKSWKELRDRTVDAIRWAKPWELGDRTKQDGQHVLMILRRLSNINCLSDPGPTLDFHDAFQSPCHYYFAVGAIRNTVLAGEVGRIIAGALISAATVPRKRRTRVILVIDEWQVLVSTQLEIVLTQARSLGVGVVLSNQTTAQMITPDIDMRPIVEGNTSFQVWMSVTDDIGREQLRKLGGKQLITLRSVSVNSARPDEVTVSSREEIVDRISPNLVSDVSADDNRFFMRLTDNAGYACYRDLIFTARTLYHQSQKEYEADCNMKWPSGTPGTIVNREAQPAPLPAANTVQSVAPRGQGQTQRLGTKP